MVSDKSVFADNHISWHSNDFVFSGDLAFPFWVNDDGKSQPMLLDEFSCLLKSAT
jgi:hypothetical protein